MEASLLPSLYTVKAIIILDNDGERLISKYYDATYPRARELKSFEKNLFKKTYKSDSEIALLEGLTVVYKNNVDLFFYVVGSSQENELMLMAVLNCLFDTMNIIFRKNVEKRILLRHLDSGFLVVDEIIDGGVIMGVDPTSVADRIVMRGEANPITEQTVAQVLQSAKDQIKWSLLK